MKVKERYDIKRLPRKLKKGLKKISLKYELGFEDLISILITKKMAPEKEIKYKPITPSAYDGSTIQRHHEDPADWRDVSNIEDRPLLSHMVEKESEAMRNFSSSWIDQYRAKYGFKIRHK